MCSRRKIINDQYLQEMCFDDNQAVMHTDGILCGTTAEVVNSRAFEATLFMFLESLVEKGDPILDGLRPDASTSAGKAYLLRLLRTLSEMPLAHATRTIPSADAYLENPRPLYLFVEKFYDFWRSFDRYLVCHSDKGPQSHDIRPYRTFTATTERLKDLIRSLYRDLCENITGEHCRVYRQVSAGADVGLIAVQKTWASSTPACKILEDIPFIRQVLINPPLIIDPPENRRTGHFLRVDTNPLEGLSLEKNKWLCYPAQVGPVVVFIYFHQMFMGLGTSLANLFELAADEQVAAGPDAIYLFGVDTACLSGHGELPTVFFDDVENNLLVAAVPGEKRFGYFGYLKKMALTLHNILMMKQGRMPYHGAMALIHLKNRCSVNILLIGDTAAGKSETLEALRLLAGNEIRGISIIADDMGSLEIREDGKVLGYGTEIGAFIRLDDLQNGYAFEQVDRAIFMSPHKINARVLVPVNYLCEVLAGTPVDCILYANNYEQVDESHPLISPLPDMEAALEVFREGAAMSKGTTTSTGLVYSYFANIFGPPQYKERHEELARKTFEAAYKSGLFVGQLRTRLGVPGFEMDGPREAAAALLEMITKDFTVSRERRKDQ
ncbi:MAG: hypothetical protein FWH25_02945 [Syntrophorhabdaceae bacterium]|nr:hypothetical protein [Syntrophorhabdaceae bacterium]